MSLNMFIARCSSLVQREKFAPAYCLNANQNADLSSITANKISLRIRDPLALHEDNITTQRLRDYFEDKCLDRQQLLGGMTLWYVAITRHRSIQIDFEIQGWEYRSF